MGLAEGGDRRHRQPSQDGQGCGDRYRGPVEEGDLAGIRRRSRRGFVDASDRGAAVTPREGGGITSAGMLGRRQGERVREPQRVSECAHGAARGSDLDRDPAAAQGHLCVDAVDYRHRQGHSRADQRRLVASQKQSDNAVARIHPCVDRRDGGSVAEGIEGDQHDRLVRGVSSRVGVDIDRSADPVPLARRRGSPDRQHGQWPEVQRRLGEDVSPGVHRALGGEERRLDDQLLATREPANERGRGNAGLGAALEAARRRSLGGDDDGRPDTDVGKDDLGRRVADVDPRDDGHASRPRISYTRAASRTRAALSGAWRLSRSAAMSSRS